MNCRDVQNSRQVHDEGSLSPSDEKAWVEHVESCEACSEALRDFPALFEELPQEPFALEDTIMTKIRAHVPERSRPAWLALLLRPAFGAGVVAGLVMLFFLSTLFRGARNAELARGEKGTGPQLEAVLLADSRLVLREGALTVNGRRFEAGNPGSESIALRSDDHVITEPGTRGALELGVAVLALRPSLDFTVHPNRLALKRGKTYVHLRRQGTEFKVTTPLLICAVRGTTFGASHDEEGSTISLVESAGEVSLSLGDGFRMTLGDGEMASVSTEGETSTTPMRESQLLETVQGAAQALGKTVQELGTSILTSLRGAGKTSGSIIDFFDRIVSGAGPAGTTATGEAGSSSSGAGSADMWNGN